jgi:hypothetical protein
MSKDSPKSDCPAAIAAQTAGMMPARRTSQKGSSVFFVSCCIRRKQNIPEPLGLASTPRTLPSPIRQRKPRQKKLNDAVKKRGMTGTELAEKAAKRPKVRVDSRQSRAAVTQGKSTRNKYRSCGSAISANHPLLDNLQMSRFSNLTLLHRVQVPPNKWTA